MLPIRSFVRFALAGVLLAGWSLAAQTAFDGGYLRDPKQAVDAAYAAKIAKYTTDPKFLSPLVSYLPVAKGMPTPAVVLGDVAGAPDMLPYAEDVYRYMRLLAASSPRARVVSIGRTEEGREMIAVAVADEALLKAQKANDEKLAALADPRTIGMDDAKAKPLIDSAFPVYYITGTIHSTETGAPTALMELAYRLATDEAPYVKYIRSHMITLITPVVEVDGRDRMVDIYKWHKANPGKDWPRLVYWGHYVAHDNNRDAMAMSLALTRNVLDTFINWRGGARRSLTDGIARRPTGRGGPGDEDLPQDRAYAEPEATPKVQPWQAQPLNEEQIRNNPQVIPEAQRPQVVLRFSEEKSLLLSGLLDHGSTIADHAIAVNAHLGEGNVLLFANNPVYRAETIGSYDLVFNAIMNFDQLKGQHPAPFSEKPADPATPKGEKSATAAPAATTGKP